MPVTVRGGGRAADEEVLDHTERLVKQGVAGLIYGRNVIQHESPERMTRALHAVLHEGRTAREAMELLKADG